MKTIYLLSVLALFLVACQDNDSLDAPIPEYELVSIQYDIREATPTEQYADGIIIDNELSTTAIYHFPPKSEAVFTSLFSHQRIDGIEFLVPIPRLDASGEITGYSAENYPSETHQWEVAVDSQGKTCEVPGNSVFRMRITNLGFQVTADFTCEMIDRTTDKTHRITGTWFGNVFTQQQTKININDKVFIEEYSPIVY